MSKIWLSPPHMSGHEIKYIEEAFRDNWIAPHGPNIDAFESQLEMFLGDGVKVSALTTGTAAIHLALIMAGVQEEDYVICQSLTFAASVNPVRYLGAHPIFVGSEEETWNLCPNAVEDAIKFAISKNKKPKAIIAICLYGMPYKVDEIRSIADQYEIPLIEDSAEALGSKYKGRNCGTFGDYSVLSFNGNKIITTSGGGALVTKSQSEKDRVLFLATQAKDNFDHYEHTSIGYNYRMSNISAGIGCGQMMVLSERIAQRRQNHEFYQNLFADIPEINLFSEPSEDFCSNHWMNVITIDRPTDDLNKDSIKPCLLHNNIECRPLWKPMHLQPIFKAYQYFGSSFAEHLFQNGICLPSGSNLKEEDKERVAEVFSSILTR